jgi:hypothetical protein
MPTYRTNDYYLAPSLVALFNEVNERWPERSKDSDGWIGDTSHQARKSDHNPDRAAGGIVRAVDITRNGIDVDELLSALVGDDRVWYVIFNRRIASVTHGWKWNPYDGANPHDKHVHVSIRHTRPAETNSARWLRKATTVEVPEVITPDDVDKIAAAVLAKIEPRLKAYAADVKKYERQTDQADADRTAQAVIAALDKRDRGN